MELWCAESTLDTQKGGPGLKSDSLQYVTGYGNMALGVIG
jgi:hypothetical protein